MHQLVAVLVPIYKPVMDEREQISFNQCLRVLGHYPIIFIKPNSLQLPDYLLTHPTIQCKSFPDHYFKNIAGYNQLMVSIDFYSSFQEFDYILIHQLDAFVFSDQLQNWCKRGFDYIGAPYIDPDRWEAGKKNPGNYAGLRRIFMNGGFSLRNVQATIRFLNLFYFFHKPWIGNEDGLFSLHFIQLRPFSFMLRLPTWRQAVQFSMEQHPRLTYALTEQTLPFGCHAWERYDPAFWQPFMDVEIAKNQ